MQNIEQKLVLRGPIGENASDGEPALVVGMKSYLVVRAVDDAGDPAPPSNISDVASWKFILAEDWNPDTNPCYIADASWNPATATWTVLLDGTRTAEMLAALGTSGAINIGCEIAGLPENGTWDKPVYVAQWTMPMRNRRDSDGAPTPLDPSPVTPHAASHRTDGVDPIAPSDIGAADASDLRYDLATPEKTANGTTVAVTLQDRAVNSVDLDSTVTAATFTLPAAVTGKARDFFVYLTIAGSTAPTIYFTDPLLANANDSAPTFEFGDLSDVDAGKNLILFTEVAAPTETAGSATATHWLVSVRHEEASA